MHNPLRINDNPNNSLNDMKPLQLFQRGVDSVIVSIVFSLRCMEGSAGAIVIAG